MTRCWTETASVARSSRGNDFVASMRSPAGVAFDVCSGSCRYDKLAANYLAFIQFASIRLWLRVNESAPRFPPLFVRHVLHRQISLALVVQLVEIIEIAGDADHGVVHIGEHFAGLSRPEG